MDKSETIFAHAGTGGDEKALANEGFSGRKIGLTVEDHGKSKERRSEGTFAEVDGLLEILRGGVELAETVVGQTEVVIGAEGRRRLLDGLLEVGEAALGITLDEEFGALLEGARGFAGHGEFVDGDDGVARSGSGLGRVGLREARAGERNEESSEEEEATWRHDVPTQTEYPLALV